jgi:predicted dinucleotide-binding enzyme
MLLRDIADENANGREQNPRLFVVPRVGRQCAFGWIELLMPCRRRHRPDPPRSRRYTAVWIGLPGCGRRQVVLSSRRGPDALGDKVAELGRGASAASVEEAASLDYVLLAVPWRNVESALKSLPAWNGRVLIDATNPFVETSPKLVLADLGGKGASEVVAALAPGARIVKAFNSIVTARFNEGPVKNGGRRVIFVSGDHPEPTVFIKQLIESFGFTAIDLGGLATGGRLQQAGGPLAGRDLVEFGHH